MAERGGVGGGGVIVYFHVRQIKVMILKKLGDL